MISVIQKYLVEKFLFKSFFSIDLTPVESEIAHGATHKYSYVFLSAFLWSLLSIPTVIFLDIGVIGVVLTPIAIVSGTAWFAVSLSTVKAKFIDFGNVLTRNIMESFMLSLFVMVYMAVVALNKNMIHIDIPSDILYWIYVVSGIFGAIVSIRIIWLITAGSLQYDMNDAMLTGQNEASQKFYEQSLSFSYQVTELIRKEADIKVTNYYIADAFSRIFNVVIRALRDKNDTNLTQTLNNINIFNEQVLVVLKNPEMEQGKVQDIFLEALMNFKGLLNTENKSAQKIGYVDIEIECLKSNTHDSDRIKALRYATIFTLIYEILTDEGEDIFLQQD